MEFRVEFSFKLGALSQCSKQGTSPCSVVAADLGVMPQTLEAIDHAGRVLRDQSRVDFLLRRAEKISAGATTSSPKHSQGLRP